jgi:peptide deformylase
MGKVLEILINPDPRLRSKAKEVDPKEIDGQRMRELAADMFTTMMEKDGIGLAAPQIGENIRLVVVNTKDGSIFLFNPIITKKSILKDWDEEGCLSVPMYFGEVKRHRSISCCFLDENGKSRKLKAHGLLARVLQHEIDHLDGVLFIDKAKNVKKIDEAEVREEE